MNNKTLFEQRVLAVLTHIKEHGPIFKDSGLCSNIITQVYIDHDVHIYNSSIQELFVGWPEHSGEREFPVPAPQGHSYTCPCEAYIFTDKWEGEYGATRMRLVDYTINKLEQALQDSEITVGSITIK